MRGRSPGIGILRGARRRILRSQHSIAAIKNATAPGAAVGATESYNSLNSSTPSLSYRSVPPGGTDASSFVGDHSHAADLRHRMRKGRMIARCPESRSSSMKRFPCQRERYCQKVFTCETSRAMHEKLHTSHKFVCPQCFGRYATPTSVSEHMALHSGSGGAPFEGILCVTCGDQFESRSKLQAHLKREPGDHQSKRAFLQFSSREEINAAFVSPLPVSGDHVCHTTSLHAASEICKSNSISRMRATRHHDGLARRNDAPDVVFFSASDVYYSLSPHPVFAEPGELTKSVFISLERFAHTPGEYRLYFVGCMFPDGHLFDQAKARVAVMFATAEHWRWCEERGLVELDIHDNGILSRAGTAQAAASNSKSFQWSVTSLMISQEYGVRGVGVVAMVASDSAGVELDGNFGDVDDQFFDAAHLLQFDGKYKCPTCHQSFSHRTRLFDHLQIFGDGEHGEVEPLRRSYLCHVDGCNKDYARKTELVNHVRSSHSALRPYKCRSCLLSFKSSTERGIHEASHAAI